MKPALVAIPLLLAGCAELNVNVDVASPQIVEERIGRLLMRDSLPDALRQADHKEEVEGLINAAIALAKRQYVDEHLRVPDPVAPHTRSREAERRREDDLKQQFNDEIAAQYNILGQQWKTVNDQIKSSYDNYSMCNKCYGLWRESVNRSGLRSASPDSKDTQRNRPCQVEHWWQKVLSCPNDRANTNDANVDCQKPHVRSDCDGAKYTEQYLVALLKQREAIIQRIDKVLRQTKVEQAVAQSTTALKSLIGEDGLFRSAEAFAISSADDSLWTKKFDDSRAVAYFGDVNVALKMETRGSFTVKGLSFDPSEIARVASRVVTQTIVAATQPATVAVQPKAIRVALDESGADPVLAIGERERRRRSALLSVANAVIEEKNAFSDTGAADQGTHDAVESISRTWEALKPLVLLEPATPLSAGVVAIVPEKILIKPAETVNEAALVVLSRKTQEETPALVKAEDGTAAPFDISPSPTISIKSGSQTASLALSGKSVGSGKIRVTTSENESATADVCVLPEIILPANSTTKGPKTTSITLETTPTGGSDVEMTVQSSGAKALLDLNVIKIKSQSNGVLRVSPREKGNVIISATIACPALLSRTTSTTITVEPSPVSVDCVPLGLKVGDTAKCTVGLADEIPTEAGFKLTLTPSADSDAVAIVDAPALQPKTVTDTEHLTFQIKGLKPGTAKVGVSSNQSIYANAQPKEVTVTESTPPTPAPPSAP